MNDEDKNFVDGALRGIREELGPDLSVTHEDIRVLSFCVEYPTLSFDVICLAHIQNSIDEIRRSWKFTAPDKHELNQSQAISISLQDLSSLYLETKRQWHPSARMRMLQVLFNIYGVPKTLSAIEEVRVHQSN